MTFCLGKISMKRDAFFLRVAAGGRKHSLSRDSHLIFTSRLHTIKFIQILYEIVNVTTRQKHVAEREFINSLIQASGIHARRELQILRL